MRDVRGYLASRKQNAPGCFQYFQSMQAYISNCDLGSKKRSNNFQFKSSLASKYIFLASLLRGPDEERNSQWWENGYCQWTEEQFKIGPRVTRETFEFILETVTDDIAKETTKFKELTSPQCQHSLTLYRLAHGCSYTTIGDLFGVAPSTACTSFNHVIRCTQCRLYTTITWYFQETTRSGRTS